MLGTWKSRKGMFTAAGTGTSAWPGYLATGQVTRHDTAGHAIPCGGSGQERNTGAAFRGRSGAAWSATKPASPPGLWIIHSSTSSSATRWRMKTGI